jgi:hypothetical protein
MQRSLKRIFSTEDVFRKLYNAKRSREQERGWEEQIKKPTAIESGILTNHV